MSSFKHRPSRLPNRRPRPPRRLLDQGAKPLKVFLSYSHSDCGAKDLLCRHLSSLEQDRFIHLWDDRQLPPGEWAREVRKQIKHADLVLLLVSSDYISSHHCAAEASSALERHDAGACITIPIILRDCDWMTRPWAQLQSLPTDGHPVTSRQWHSIDEAFTDVARRLRNWLSPLQVLRRAC